MPCRRDEPRHGPLRRHNLTNPTLTPETLDLTGTPILRDSRPPAISIADTAGLREPWASRCVREVTSELTALVLRPDCEFVGSDGVLQTHPAR